MIFSQEDQPKISLTWKMVDLILGYLFTFWTNQKWQIFGIGLWSLICIFHILPLWRHYNSQNLEILSHHIAAKKIRKNWSAEAPNSPNFFRHSHTSKLCSKLNPVVIQIASTHHSLEEASNWDEYYIYLEPKWGPSFLLEFRPCFGGLTFKNRGHWGSRYIILQDS